MAADKKKKESQLKFMQEKNYLAKDYSSFKQELTTYARSYFLKQNADFSEASFGGMLIDLAAYVGDSMTYFLDHQFSELDPMTAVEARNVQKHATNAGVKEVGPAPANLTVKIFIEVPSEQNSTGDYQPKESNLPKLLAGTSMSSRSGPKFSTIEDLDFAEKDINGNLLASSQVSSLDSSGNPLSYIMTRETLAVSGEIRIQTTRIAAPTPFRQISLQAQNVTDILSVKDSNDNEYYEVDYLSQDVVYRKVRNFGLDQAEVPSTIEMISAGKRYFRSDDMQTGITTLTFGGNLNAQAEELIPDPSELALPLYGKKTFKRFSLDPRNFQKTNTLGDAPGNTTLKIEYRVGGGLSHNIDIGDIDGFTDIRIQFDKNPPAVESANVVQSLDVINEQVAKGGAPKLSREQVKGLIRASKNQQSRIVSQEDLLARIFTLPSEFGRVYRASLQKSARNPLATEIFVASRDKNGRLTTAPDTLKKNLVTYLNEYRLISDAIDILDATIINYGVEFEIIVTPGSNKQQVTSRVVNELMKIGNTQNYQIDQPLIEADFINAIINTPGVLSMPSMTIYGISGLVGSNVYSDFTYDIEANTFKGMTVGPPGSIFELRFPDVDIVGSAE